MRKIAVVTIVALIFCSGCSMNFKERREFADLYVKTFEGGDYEKMYGMLDKTIRQDITYGDFHGFHEYLIKSLGKIRNFESPKIKFQITGPIHIFYTYRISFEKEWGIYILALSEKNRPLSVVYIDLISETEARRKISEMSDSMPNYGVPGMMKFMLKRASSEK